MVGKLSSLPQTALLMLVPLTAHAGVESSAAAENPAP